MPLRHILLALVVVAIWGFNFVVIKWSVEALPPILAAALRFTAAAFPLVFFVKPPKSPVWIVVGYGLCLGFMLYAFLNLALAWGMPAGLASLVLQTQAFFTMALAFPLLGDRPGKFQLAGAAIAFSGIAVIALERLEGASLLPLVFTIFGAISWGMANVLTKMAGKVDALSFNVWGALAAPAPLLGLSLVTEGWPTIVKAITQFSWADAAMIAFLAYISTILAGAIWSWLLGKHPTSVVAPFTLLVPITGLLSGYLILGEMITPIEILGAVVVISGLVVTVMGRKKTVPLVVAD
jgi:O-acetylserine/cysteine efflux transporter